MHNKKKTCPHCRKEGFESVLNKAMIREINEFCIKCSNHEKGCGWVGELGDLEKHIESENGCGYVMVRCKYFAGFLICSHECQRRCLAEHQRRCTLRPYKCEHCGEVDTYDAIAGEGKIFLNSNSPSNRFGSNHYTTCDQYPLKCPNKCGEKTIKRCDIPSHRKQCPLEPLSCPFKNVGCSSEIPQRDMDSHCHTNMQTHLLMMARSHDELLRKNEELHRKNEELTKRLTALEKKK